MATTITWIQPSIEVLNNISQNAARLNQQIAVISRNTQTAKTDKTDNYFFLSSSDGSLIKLRNDKKEILNLHIDLCQGLSYETPSMRDGSPNVDLINLIADISKNTDKLDTSLGLDWLTVAFNIYRVVIMRRVDSVSTEIVNATINDWVTAIKSVSDVNNTIVITDWLVNKSYMASKLNSSEKTTLTNLVTELTNSLSTKQGSDNKQGQTVTVS